MGFSVWFSLHPVATVRSAACNISRPPRTIDAISSDLARARNRAGGSLESAARDDCAQLSRSSGSLTPDFSSGSGLARSDSFISYSTKDQDFAERLHADLQNKGVRCWYAPDDLKIGDPFRQRIDDAIRLHEKLLVILSRHSVQSDWVHEEVESCFEREHREKSLVLFPVRLDDTVVDTDAAWAASIRRQRHIGDFSKWKRPRLVSRAV